MLHPFEQHIQNTIDRLGLLRRSSPVIVALSGGADSVALLSVLVALGFDCIAAHCNFHLRGAESLRDMRHAEEIARRLCVNIYIREFNVAERTKRTGESVEMACRALRYDWFHELLDRDFSQAIAVGHHREDNIETFFINLLRSTGLNGLTGMDYRRGFVVRPMLDVTRSEIEAYLHDKGLDFVTDSTNAENDFVRNRLRNIVLPTIETHFPGTGAAVLAVIDHLRDSQSIISHVVDECQRETTDKNGSIDVAAVLDRFGAGTGRSVLFEMIRREGLNASQTADIVRAVEGGATGLQFVIDERRVAELDRGILSFHLLKGKNDETKSFAVSLGHDILTPVNIQVSPHNILEFKPLRDPKVIYLDAKAVKSSAVFELRHPRRGDRMKPFGMTGEKLVSDILKDAKLTSEQKRNAWLLTRNGKILWIVGLRASAHFTVTPETRRYLKLVYVPDPT